MQSDHEKISRDFISLLKQKRTIIINFRIFSINSPGLQYSIFIHC